MSKCLMVLNFLFFVSIGFSQDISVTELRDKFALAPKNKKWCERVISNLSASENDALKLAYLGAYQTVWANHVLNPFSKLRTFNKGKNNLDKAAELDADHIEIRALRYAIQFNSPGFLGYKNNLVSDRNYIKEHIDKVSSVEERDFILTIVNQK